VVIALVVVGSAALVALAASAVAGADAEN
jgi:hypothetical protein